MSIVSDNTVRAYFRPNFQQGLQAFHRGWPGRGTLFITHGGAVRKSNFPLHDAAGPVLTGTVTFTNVRDREMILL